MNDIKFWDLLERCRPHNEHFGDSICRALELAAGLPEGSIAWFKLDYPGMQLFLFEEDNTGTRLEILKRAVGVTQALPSDGDRGPGKDWIVSFRKLITVSDMLG